MQMALSRHDATAVIRLLRRSLRSLTQELIGQMTGLSQSTISRIESGRQSLNEARTRQILTALGAPQTTQPTPQDRPAALQQAQPEQDPVVLHGEVIDEGPASEDGPREPRLEDLLADSVDDYTVAGLEQRLIALATAYVSTPLAPLLPRVRELRATALRHYQAGARLRHAYDLLVIVGMCDLLLAHAAHDSGDPAAALARLADADRCAVYTAHPHLSSWITGTRALIADWYPTSDASLAPAHQTPHSPQAWARLTAIQARAAARRNDTSTARIALEQLLAHPATAPEDPEELSVRVGGILSFPAPKRDYYIASTLVLLGDGDQALHHSTRSITTYETGPTIHRSYGDLALARTDLVKAHLLRGDTPSALFALDQVARTSPPTRIHQLRPALAACAQLAQQAPITSREAHEVTEVVTALRIP